MTAIDDEFHVKFLTLTAQNIFKDMMDGNIGQQVTAWGEFHALCRENYPIGPLSIINGFGRTQLLFIEEAVVMGNPSIQSHASAVVNLMEEACIEIHGLRMDIYMQQRDEELQAAREVGGRKLISIDSSARFRTAQTPPL